MRLRWGFYDGRYRQGDPDAERAAGVAVWGVTEVDAAAIPDHPVPVDGFTPIRAGGRDFHTRAEWDAWQKLMADRVPGFKIEGRTARQGRADLDDHCHDIIERARKDGGSDKAADQARRLDHLLEHGPGRSARAR